MESAIRALSPQDLIEGLPVGVFLLSPSLCLSGMNRSLEVLTGFLSADVGGLPCKYVLRSSLCPRNCPGARALAENRRVQATGNIINRSRETVPVRITASPLVDENGNTAGVLETVEELSRAPAADSLETGDSPMVGVSPALRKVLDLLPAVAQTDSSVLITGETGTGKDLLASLIHQASPRAAGPFVKVNCGALPEGLLESELFGHVRGAFTGAVADKPGRFQLAEGGTVYLTEIGDLPLPLQVKLLTFLDDKEAIPVGGTKSVKTDVRVIAATHRNLESMVSQGGFRADLLYRLNIVRLHIPPLREREGDLRLLLAHFLSQYRERFGKNLEGFSPKARSLLGAYSFPGNVRELKNIVEYAASVCPSGEITPEHLPEYLTAPREQPPEFPAPESPAPDLLLPNAAAKKGGTWETIEREMIVAALVACRGNRSRAAARLGWGRSTLWRKMKQHGL
ncbi:MAG: sigma 54-interacting transcriptional regulator [Deltaproteobacteria bacterium]|nr:sigma 54-interacting transcriptional regulator [Deltaproteobacteria bacterium]